MKLGDSLRRRRKGVTRSPGADAADPPGRFPLLDNLWAVLALGLALAVVGSTIGYLVGTRALFPAPQGPTDLVEVPELSGLTADSALLALADGGLTLGSVDTIRHPEVPVGLTLGQSPLAVQLALPGDSIRIVVSAGPEERPVPDLVGIRGDRARDVLDAAGFTVLEDTVQPGASPRRGASSGRPFRGRGPGRRRLCGPRRRRGPRTLPLRTGSGYRYRATARGEANGGAGIRDTPRGGSSRHR